jgi:uncharacterized protein YnzC (UPF0291/DUF896 family)
LPLNKKSLLIATLILTETELFLTKKFREEYLLDIKETRKETLKLTLELLSTLCLNIAKSKE